MVINVLTGFTKSQRTPKRLRDIAPDDVEAPLSSEAEDSDGGMSPSKPGRARGGKPKKRKAKKADGWIWRWFERVTTGDSGNNETLEEYKRESKFDL